MPASLALLAFAFSAAALAAPQPRDVAAAPSGFDITSITFSGSGCGSPLSALSAGKDATIIFAEFYASAGSGVSPSENHKTCVVSLDVTIPSGFSFGLKGLRTATFYHLDSGVSASQTATYSFGSTTATSPLVVNGPAPATSVNVEHTFGTLGSVRSPCGGKAVLKVGLDLVLDVNSTGGSGAIAKDTLNLIQSTHYDWATC